MLAAGHANMSKSIRDAVEAAITSYLADAELGEGVQIEPGMSTALLKPPIVIAAVTNVAPHPQLYFVPGNFSAQVTISIMTPAQGASAEQDHAALCEAVRAAMTDETGLKAAFTTMQDAAMYFCNYTGESPANAEEHLGTAITYEVLGVNDCY